MVAKRLARAEVELSNIYGTIISHAGVYHIYPSIRGADVTDVSGIREPSGAREEKIDGVVSVFWHNNRILKITIRSGYVRDSLRIIRVGDVGGAISWLGTYLPILTIIHGPEWIHSILQAMSRVRPNDPIASIIERHARVLEVIYGVRIRRPPAWDVRVPHGMFIQPVLLRTGRTDTAPDLRHRYKLQFLDTRRLRLYGDGESVNDAEVIRRGIWHYQHGSYVHDGRGGVRGLITEWEAIEMSLVDSDLFRQLVSR